MEIYKEKIDSLLTYDYSGKKENILIIVEYPEEFYPLDHYSERYKDKWEDEEVYSQDLTKYIELTLNSDTLLKGSKYFEDVNWFADADETYCDLARVNVTKLRYAQATRKYIEYTLEKLRNLYKDKNFYFIEKSFSASYSYCILKDIRIKINKIYSVLPLPGLIRPNKSGSTTELASISRSPSPSPSPSTQVHTREFQFQTGAELGLGSLAAGS